MILETLNNIKRHAKLRAMNEAEIFAMVRDNNPNKYNNDQLHLLTNILLSESHKRPEPQADDVFKLAFDHGTEMHYTYKLSKGFGFYPFYETDWRYLLY